MGGKYRTRCITSAAPNTRDKCILRSSATRLHAVASFSAERRACRASREMPFVSRLSARREGRRADRLDFHSWPSSWALVIGVVAVLHSSLIPRLRRRPSRPSSSHPGARRKSPARLPSKLNTLSLFPHRPQRADRFAPLLRRIQRLL